MTKAGSLRATKEEVRPLGAHMDRLRGVGPVKRRLTNTPEMSVELIGRRVEPYLAP